MPDYYDPGGRTFESCWAHFLDRRGPLHPARLTPLRARFASSLIPFARALNPLHLGAPQRDTAKAALVGSLASLARLGQPVTPEAVAAGLIAG